MLIFSRYTYWVGAMVALAVLLAVVGRAGLLDPVQDVFLRVTGPMEEGVSSVFGPSPASSATSVISTACRRRTAASAARTKPSATRMPPSGSRAASSRSCGRRALSSPPTLRRSCSRREYSAASRDHLRVSFASTAAPATASAWGTPCSPSRARLSGPLPKRCPAAPSSASLPIAAAASPRRSRTVPRTASPGRWGRPPLRARRGRREHR